MRQTPGSRREMWLSSMARGRATSPGVAALTNATTGHPCNQHADGDRRYEETGAGDRSIEVQFRLLVGDACFHAPPALSKRPQVS
jgi:hypothetical protein